MVMNKQAVNPKGGVVMRRRNLIAAMIAGAALWLMGGPASAQFAELPFLTDELAPPNVHWFMDNSGYLNQLAKQDALKRKQFEVFRDVMAGTKEFIYYQGSPVFTPYYSNTVDSYWLGDELQVVMPKIIRLSETFEGFVPDSGGEFFMFYYNGDPFAQDFLVESALTTIDVYMRQYTQKTDTE